jgi:hypothetical protein
MPSYRIHRLKDHLRVQFRFGPHVSGAAHIKPRDYALSEGEPGASIDAPTPYAAFFALKETDAPLAPGDVLEAENGALRIFKFVGFEEAQWTVPEVKTEEPSEPG